MRCGFLGRVFGVLKPLNESLFLYGQQFGEGFLLVII
jgi:hypothetical protein